MQIYGIRIYRDGGTIEFYIENGEKLTRVRLDTPFSGEPRVLRFDSFPVAKGDQRISVVREYIERWWGELPQAVRAKAEDIFSDDKLPSGSDEATLYAIDLSRVLYVREYIRRNYES